MQPTADHVARAIVAACRETGEDPLVCAQGAMGIRARHYAMHALRHVFPDLSSASAAVVCGCPGKPVNFWNNSLSQVIRVLTAGPNAGKRAARWWDEDVYARVIEATGGERPAPRQAEHPNPRPAPTPAPYKRVDLPPARKLVGGGTLERNGYRPAPGTAARVLADDDEDDDRPVFDHGQFAGNRRGGAQPSASKRQMADDLAEAFRNTAKIPVPDE